MKKTKVSIILSILVVTFYYYNFRWVEFTPQQITGRGWSGWQDRKDLWDNAPKELKECLKKSLEYYHQDYKEKDDKLYIRAFLQRDKAEISYYVDGWSVPKKQVKEKCFDRDGRPNGNDKREGFFVDILSYRLDWLGRFLDKLFMYK